MPKATKDISDIKTRRPRGSKKVKDPNKPKRPMTAFFLFSAEFRDQVKKDNPELKVGGVAKVLGERWRNLPEADKQKYQAKVDIDKKRYESEMDAYNNKLNGVDEDEEEDDDEE